MRSFSQSCYEREPSGRDQNVSQRGPPCHRTCRCDRQPARPRAHVGDEITCRHRTPLVNRSPGLTVNLSLRQLKRVGIRSARIPPRKIGPDSPASQFPTPVTVPCRAQSRRFSLPMPWPSEFACSVPGCGIRWHSLRQTARQAPGPRR